MLLATSGPYTPRTFTVPPAGGLIGRSRKCRISLLHDCEVSHNHAVIELDKGGVLCIRDVGSTFGTYLNDKRLSEPKRASDPHKLKAYDSIKVGQTSLRWRPIELIERSVVVAIPEAPRPPFETLSLVQKDVLLPEEWCCPRRLLGLHLDPQSRQRPRPLPQPRRHAPSRRPLLTSSELSRRLLLLSSERLAHRVPLRRSALAQALEQQSELHHSWYPQLCRAIMPVDLPLLCRRVDQVPPPRRLPASLPALPACTQTSPPLPASFRTSQPTPPASCSDSSCARAPPA